MQGSGTYKGEGRSRKLVEFVRGQPFPQREHIVRALMHLKSKLQDQEMS